MLDIAWKPKLATSQLTTAARNAWGLSLGGGITPVERTASELVFSGHHRNLYRFAGTGRSRPVLLVPPLAAPAHCFDLRPGQSLAAHLAGQDRSAYVVDYGSMHRSDRRLGFEYWTENVLPSTIRRISALHDGAPVDLIGWSLGGTISLLTAGSHPELPIGSVTAIGTPIDYTKIPALEPLRMIGRVTTEKPLTTLTWAAGGVPAPFVQVGYRFTALEREVTKPWFIAQNLNNTETLARMEAIDRFQSDMPGYPARLFHQMASQLVLGNALTNGRVVFGRRTIDLADVSVPVLAIGGTDDVLAPADSVAPVSTVLTGAPDVRFETAPGSHLGLVAGPNASKTSWSHIDTFLDDVSAVRERTVTAR